jgi:hypothetical protein
MSDVLYGDPDVLNDPVRVRAVVGEDLLELEDGRRIRLSGKVDRLEDRIASSGREVEVVPQSTEADGVIRAEFFVRRHWVVCGYGLPSSDVWVRSPLKPLKP